MGVTSNRNVQVEFLGDVQAEIIQSALENTVSPGMSIVQTLASGANTLTAPVVSGLVVTALTIVPPSGNTVQMTLKGVTGDTGILLHLTDPTTIALAPTFVSLVINAASSLVGLRLIWS